MRRLLSLTLLLSLTAAMTLPADAQSVTFRGKVEDVSGTQNQFFVDCTNTSLTSGAFNLNLFVGQQVEITGQWNGSTAAPSVDVAAIAVVPEVFELGGGAKIGDELKVGFIATPGDLAISRITVAPSFTDLGASGVVFVDLSKTVIGTTGVIPGGGILQHTLQIPNDPSLVGLEIFGQGALIDSLGNLTLTNPDCKTIDS
ncbi:MAG: hypothetical protein P1V81_14675 [Planctomycetota bacterium]|nr:hypothetical protein [Planctomycetota bacterium]